MDENRQRWKILLIVPLLAQLVIGFYSCYKAFKSFNVPGVGQEVRVRVIKRQMMFVIITVICNSPLTFIEVFKFFIIHISNDYKHDDPLIVSLNYLHDYIFVAVQYSTPLWLSFLILSDPFTFLILKKSLRFTSKKKR